MLFLEVVYEDACSTKGREYIQWKDHEADHTRTLMGKTGYHARRMRWRATARQLEIERAQSLVMLGAL